MKFYLGTHLPNWLRSADMPLFISTRRLMRYKTLPIAHTSWALDSNGYSEIKDYGRWTISALEYAGMTRRFYDGIGRMDFAAIQDWMCEPFILDKTGLSIAEHQTRTVESYRTLMDIDDELPWLPVLQGFQLDDYRRCLDMYRASGFDNEYFGIGSVCRRQSTKEAEAIILSLYGEGVKLHAFGFKIKGLANVASTLASADSMAWSFDARRTGYPYFPWCTHSNCANCYDFADYWYNKIANLNYVDAE